VIGNAVSGLATGVGVSITSVGSGDADSVGCAIGDASGLGSGVVVGSGGTSAVVTPLDQMTSRGWRDPAWREYHETASDEVPRRRKVTYPSPEMADVTS
jgi:hypothetical protein